MRELTLDPAELALFSVSYPLCLAGERQYALGLGAIALATNLRLGVQVTETADDFRLRAHFLHAEPDAAVLDVLRRWRRALEEQAVPDHEDLSGLCITLALGDIGMHCAPEAALSGPAVAVALACAVQAHRGRRSSVATDDLVEMAGALLAEHAAPRQLHRDRFCAQCRVSLEGGARYVVPGAEPLNVQLLLPPDALMLVAAPEAEVQQQAPPWEALLLDALQQGGGAARLLEATEQNPAALFEEAAGKLNEAQTAVLYGLLRVREMIEGLLDRMGEALLDHDRLAELCDEESAMLLDLLQFPAGRLMEVRDAAVDAGALGGRLTYIFDGRPALILLAPGCREDVLSRLRGPFPDHSVLLVDVDPDGLRIEE